MREIKFRARWKDTNKVIEDFMEDSFIDAINDECLIVEQWTGLKDINRTDIYEGDILIIDKEKCLVFYSQADCSFSLDYDGRKFPLTQDLITKVIGSIYD